MRGGGREGEGGRVRVWREGVDEKRQAGFFFVEMTEFSNFFFFMLK